jgi:hypothetical protein
MFQSKKVFGNLKDSQKKQGNLSVPGNITSKWFLKKLAHMYKDEFY